MDDWLDKQSDGDRWFYLKCDRLREKNRRQRYARNRAVKREASREAAKPVGTSSIISEWTIDEFGNLSRTITGKK